MGGQLLKSLVPLTITLLCLGSMLSALIWYKITNDDAAFRRPAHLRKRAPKTIDLCEGCREAIGKVLKEYSQTWKKQEDNYQKFRAELNSSCHGREKAIITQINTPVGAKILYESQKKKKKGIEEGMEVTPEIFNAFPKESPFLNKTWDTCSVVGSGGILADSGCGEEIDSAQFVIRCNLPPLTDGYEEHVGVKTSLVTANPSIFREKFGSLMGHRRAFVESLKPYGDSLLLLPAFSRAVDSTQCLRVFDTLEDFGSPIQPVFFNSEYLQDLAEFWRSRGLQARRPSSGIFMVSLAIELCKNVHLYGFWPFGTHPYGLHFLNNHYYDNRMPGKIHAMPAEFEFLMRLHNDGVLKLQLGDCQPGKK